MRSWSCRSLNVDNNEWIYVLKRQLCSLFCSVLYLGLFACLYLMSKSKSWFQSRSQWFLSIFESRSQSRKTDWYFESLNPSLEKGVRILKVSILSRLPNLSLAHHCSGCVDVCTKLHRPYLLCNISCSCGLAEARWRCTCDTGDIWQWFCYSVHWLWDFYVGMIHTRLD